MHTVRQLYNHIHILLRIYEGLYDFITRKNQQKGKDTTHCIQILNEYIRNKIEINIMCT